MCGQLGRVDGLGACGGVREWNGWGNGWVGRVKGKGRRGTHVENQDLEFVGINHSGSPVQRSEEVNTRSSEVTYTEVQPKGGDEDTHVVKNELYN